jgi:prepilin-type processing-associated H-X9-DG protein
MKPLIKILLGVVVGLIVVGLAAGAINKVRRTAELVNCTNHLKQLGIGVWTYHDTYQRFPTGTCPAPDLPPEKRLSWITLVYPNFMVSASTCFDRNKSWDAPENCPPPYRVPIFHKDGGEHVEIQRIPEARYFVCPGAAIRINPIQASITDYLGVAGVGEDAADLPVSDPRAGVFGNDRTVKIGQLGNGPSTLLVLEAPDGGPWTAGGRATIRPLVPDGSPYLGLGGQFAGNHPQGWPPSRNQLATNALFADGSVRALAPSMSPKVLEAHARLRAPEDFHVFPE